MWFILEEDLKNVDPSIEYIQSGLAQLLYSVSSGKHAIASSPSTAKHLNNDKILPIQKSILTKIYNQSSELIAQAQKSKFKIRVTSDFPEGIRSTSTNEWVISLRFLADNGVPDSTIIGEDLSDIDVFKICGEQYKAEKKIATKIHLKGINGGGASTPKVYEEEIKQNSSFAFCITDSDKIHPEKNHNTTSEKCKNTCADYLNIDKKEKGWVTTHEILTSREIENFIPINIVDDCIHSSRDPIIASNLSAIKEAITSNPMAWDYIDLKEGTKLGKIIQNKPGFWDQIIIKNTKLGLCNDLCVKNKECRNKDECTCQITPGISKKILDHIIEYLKTHSTHEMTKRASTSQNLENWFHIGELICSWGASFPKTRS